MAQNSKTGDIYNMKIILGLIILAVFAVSSSYGLSCFDCKHHASIFPNVICEKGEQLTGEVCASDQDVCVKLKGTARYQNLNVDVNVTERRCGKSAEEDKPPVLEEFPGTFSIKAYYCSKDNCNGGEKTIQNYILMLTMVAIAFFPQVVP